MAYTPVFISPVPVSVPINPNVSIGVADNEPGESFDYGMIFAFINFTYGSGIYGAGNYSPATIAG